MEVGDGMVAVVRSLRDSGLAVTLLDSGRQFTLRPETYIHPSPRTNKSNTIASQCASEVARQESSAQATDGRYTSTYKMMHCHFTPTSPPEQVTEFPPQRVEVCPGQGNFVVGGQGSGENHNCPIKSTEFRGAMCWPDRGSVFSPRPSHQPDHFATSLRKYPNITPDRSSEIVERLISFTQAKNSDKNRTASPVRNLDSDMSNQTLYMDSNSFRNKGTGKRIYEPEIIIRPKRFEESPTRERSRQVTPDTENMESWRKQTFCKSNDVRYLRDVTRKVREGIRHLSAHPDNRPERLNPREQFDSSNGQRKVGPQWSTNTVNMEIQAAVEMMSKEVVTLPTITPDQRTIAVPLTPKPSNTEDSNKTSVALNFEEQQAVNNVSQIIQTNLNCVDMHVQTVSSAIEISIHKKCKRRNRRRSRSEEEISINRLINYDNRASLKPCCLRSLSYRKSHNKSKSNKILLEIAKILDSKLCNLDHYQNRKTKYETSHNKNIKYYTSNARIFRADISPHKILDENSLIKILEDWIDLIPLKVNNICDIQKEKEYLFFDLFNYLTHNNYSSYNHKFDKSKHDILDRLKLMPLGIKDDTKVLHRLVDNLMNKIAYVDRAKWNIDVNDNTKYQLHHQSPKMVKSLTSPKENVIRNFISEEVICFLRKLNLKFHQELIRIVEDELLNIIRISGEEICDGYTDCVTRDIIESLHNCGLPKHQAYYLAKNLIRRYKEAFTNEKGHRVRSETLIVLPNLQNIVYKSPQPMTNETNLTITSITDEDIFKNLEHYTDEIYQQINEWLNDLQLEIPETQEGFRQVVVSDLAEDIVDRHKYLELNPSNKVSDEDELEHLKYQIFKWINKLVGPDNLITIQRAPELMNRIKRIPFPMITRPSGHNNICGNQSINPNIGMCKPPDKYKTGNSVSEKLFDSNKPICNNKTCDGSMDTTTKNLECLNAEYDQFIKNWIQKIPIKASNPEEEAIFEKAKLGLYNGLCKAVLKLNSDPASYFNRFLYEDLLDDAIDELLDCLPQTAELQAKRHLLKVEFIEKTTRTNDLVKETQKQSFKHILVNNVASNVRNLGIVNNQDDPIKLHEDMQIMKLVDNYLLSTSFAKDNVKCAIYRKKLLQEAEGFVQDLKKNHSTELQEIDVSSFVAEIINNLQRVPIPSEDTVKREAEDVLLDVEIEQWYGNLPVIKNDNYTEQYRRKKQRDILAMKIKDIEKKNCDFNESELRHEVSLFLGKTPLKDGESLNINFMVDGLVNKLKDKAKHNTKKVVFQSPKDYNEFSNDISLCSSFTAIPKSKGISISQDNKSKDREVQCHESCGQQSLINNSMKRPDIHNGISTSMKTTRGVLQDPQSYSMFDEERPSSSSFKETSNQHWHSLQQSKSDNKIQTQNNNMQTLPPYERSIESGFNDYEKLLLHNTQEKISSFNDCGTQKCTQNNTSPRVTLLDSYQPEPYIPPDRRGIKTDRGILGISQIAGPSGYRNDQRNKNTSTSRTKFESLNDSSSYQVPYRHDVPQYKQHISEEKIIEQIPNKEASRSKCSMECQTLNKTNLGDQATENNNQFNENQINEGTSTSMNISGSRQPMFASTPQNTISPNIPSGPSKRRGRLAIRDRDGVTRKLGFDSEDEDDDVPCRCIEKYIKSLQSRYGEDFDRLPPCVPIFFPYFYIL